MKKPVLLILCVLFFGCAAYGESYTVSGWVYLGDSDTKVPYASIQITCTWGPNNQCTGGGGNLGNENGSYSITMPDCGDISKVCQNEDSCVDRNMVVQASKQIAGILYSGAASYVAKASNESQNIRIYQTNRDDFLLGAEPGSIGGPWPHFTETLVAAFDANGGPTTEVTGFNATLTYDMDKMACTSIGPMPPFVITYSNLAPGLIQVEGQTNPPGSHVPLGDAQVPTPLFRAYLTVPEPTTVDCTYVVTDKVTEIQTTLGPVGVVQSSSQIQLGESTCKPYFNIADLDDWSQADANGHVYPMEPNQWEGYITQWQDFNEEGEPYPDDEFKPAGLYIYEGNETDPCGPHDAGLVMYWGDGNDGSSSSAWVWDYKKDPDLSNCTINLVVTAPQFGLGVNGQVNKVSFGLQNPPQVGGPIRAWYWNCGPAGSGAPITWGVPTRLTINTSLTGVNAATPTASAYMNNPGFSLKMVQWLLLDENGTWVGGLSPAPGPGGGPMFLWNYWHWVMISPNTTLTKEYYKKWSQAAVIIDTGDPPLIEGWDEYSNYYIPPIVADDWKCTDDRPITDLHWWGSFIGWNAPDPPPVLPKSFHIGIWSDVPDPNKDDPCDFSRPGQLIWEHFCDNYVMNFAGYDADPRFANPDPCIPIEPTEACFQFNQLLSQEDWFYQNHDPCDVNGTIYWLSISAVWDPCEPPPMFVWGWKTRPHYFNDDAVQIQGLSDGSWPPVVGSMWGSGIPIQFPPYPNPDSISFDMAFDLTTNKPSPNDPPASPDLNFDGTVNLADLAVLANRWLDTVQY
jgi:hypothetical protein